MNCWKSINLSRDYGIFRILIIAMITMFFSFTLLYLIFSIHSTVALRADHFIMFALGMLFISPTHKAMHMLPLILAGKKVKIRLQKRNQFVPVMQIRLCQSTPRNLYMLAILFPAVLITSATISLSIVMPEYMHYFIIAASLNIGLCVPDFIYFKQFFHAPKRCFVQDFDGGLDILVDNRVSSP